MSGRVKGSKGRGGLGTASTWYSILQRPAEADTRIPQPSGSLISWSTLWLLCQTLRRELEGTVPQMSPRAFPL